MTLYSFGQIYAVEQAAKRLKGRRAKAAIAAMLKATQNGATWFEAELIGIQAVTDFVLPPPETLLPEHVFKIIPALRKGEQERLTLMRLMAAKPRPSSSRAATKSRSAKNTKRTAVERKKPASRRRRPGLGAVALR